MGRERSPQTAELSGSQVLQQHGAQDNSAGFKERLRCREAGRGQGKLEAEAGQGQTEVLIMALFIVASGLK